jgi:fucose permease
LTLRQQLLLAGVSLLLSGYAVLSPGSAFPLMCFGYFLVGCGLALLNAQMNAFISTMQNPSAMGIAHASYGACSPPPPSSRKINNLVVGCIGTGALISPLIATQFAQIEHWYFHYLFLLGATIITLSVIVIFFRGKAAEGISLYPSRM